MAFSSLYQSSILDWLLRGGAAPNNTAFAYVGVGLIGSVDEGVLEGEPWAVPGYERVLVTWSAPEVRDEGYVCTNTNKIVFPAVSDDAGGKDIWAYGLFNSSVQGGDSSLTGALSNGGSYYPGDGIIIQPGELVVAADYALIQ